MRTCFTCGAELLSPYEKECDVCAGTIVEGCTVAHDLDSTDRGVAFMRNKAGIWLVQWFNGRISIINENFLKRVKQ